MDQPGIWQAQHVLDENPLAPEEAFKINFMYHGPNSSACVTRIREQKGIPPHIHRTHDEVVHILEGEAQFRFGKDTRKVKPGDIIAVPAGVVHSPFFTPTGLTLLSVFAPQFDPAHPDREFIKE
jgi:quercetin dioxygenase-like cupin family protein